MSLHALAGHMSAKGRGPDSMLVHMSPREVASLQALAVKNGTSLTINPDTGLPEALKLKDILPALAGVALGPAGLGLMSGTMAGLTVGGITTLATGSLSRGLMAGMGAYGASGLAEGLMGAGAGAAQSAAMSGLTQEQIAAKMAETGLSEQGVLNQAAADATSKYASSGFGDRLTQGASAAMNNPKGFVEGMGGVGKLAQTGLAAIAPIMADQGVQTTTQRPSTPANIRKYSFDPYGGKYTFQGMYPAEKDQGMAQGGIVALAEGGTSAPTYTSYSPEVITKYLQDNPNADIAAATAKFNADPRIVNQTISQLGAGFLDPTQSTRGSGSGQYFNTFSNAGIDANELYAANKALNPNYNFAGDKTAEGLNRAFEIAKEFKGFDPQNSAPIMRDIEWVKKMDAENANAFDIARLTGLSIGEVETREKAARERMKQLATPVVLPSGTGVSGGGNAWTNPGDRTLNPDGSITTRPDFSLDMNTVRDKYTAGGGSLGYVNPAPKTMDEFNQRFNKQTGSSLAAHKYLMGEGAYPTNSSTTEIMKPYSESALGIAPAAGRPTQKYIYDNKTRTYKTNPDFIPVTYDSEGKRVVGVSDNQILDQLKTVPAAAGGLMQRYADGGAAQESVNEAQQKLNDFLIKNNVPHERIASLLNISVAEAKRRYPLTGPTKAATFDTTQQYGDSSDSYKAAPSAWDNMTIDQRAAYFAENPREAAVAHTLAGLAKNVTSMGLLASYFDPISTGERMVSMRGVGLGPEGYMAQQNARAEVNSQQPEFSTQWDGGFRDTLGDQPGDYDGQSGSYDHGGPGPAGSGSTGGGLGGVGGEGTEGSNGPGDGTASDYARGGLSALARGGAASQYNLGSYSDGGRLLRGPGDGVSDSIPATIGNKQPARLADGEFVVPARIVSELGNGSTEAGARKLYAMMDRVQKARGKTTGKNRVAANTRSDKYLPA